MCRCYAAQGYEATLCIILLCVDDALIGVAIISFDKCFAA